MPMRVREVKRIAVRKGWIYSHHTGSHAQYYHPTILGVLTIPGADHKELHPTTERSLKNQLGIQ